MTNRKIWIYSILGLCLFFMLLIIIMFYLPPGLDLTFNQLEGGRPLLKLPLKSGECFTLHYIHSVNGCPIWEEHRVDAKGNIYIEEERFMVFGAGMGHWPGHGILKKRGKFQVIENISKPLGSFILRVAEKENNHTIIWRGIHLNLSDMAPGRALIVSAVPCNIFKRYWGRIFPPNMSKPSR